MRVAVKAAVSGISQMQKMKGRASTEAIAELLTVADVAKLDRCSPKTVRRAIAEGLLEVIRVGPGRRLVRIDPEAHAAYRRARSADLA